MYMAQGKADAVAQGEGGAELQAQGGPWSAHGERPVRPLSISYIGICLVYI